MVIQEWPCGGCALRPIRWFGRLFAFAPFNVRCATNEQQCYFSTSTLWICIGVLYPMMLIANIAIGSTSFAILSDEEKKNRQIVIRLVIVSMDQGGALLLTIFNILQAGTQARAHNSVCKFMHQPTKGIVRALSKKDERYIFILGLRQIFVASVVLTIQTILSIIYVMNTDNGKIKWNMGISIGIDLICRGVLFVTILYFCILAKMLEAMIDSAFSRLREVLTQASSRLKPIDVGKGDESPKKLVYSVAVKPLSSSNANKMQKFYGNKDVALCDQMGETRVGYEAILKCLTLLNGGMNPQLIIVISWLAFLIVINAYLALQSELKYENLPVFCFASMNLFTYVIFVIYMTSTAESLYKMREQILQYVVYTRAMYFTLHEMTQMEMLLQQLNISPPLFTASNVFNYNAGMLSTMLGTIITYVLVALQFQ